MAQMAFSVSLHSVFVHAYDYITIVWQTLVSPLSGGMVGDISIRPLNYSGKGDPNTTSTWASEGIFTPQQKNESQDRIGWRLWGARPHTVSCRIRIYFPADERQGGAKW